MNTVLYLEGACGISGDMTVAALLDLGADAQKLNQALKSLTVKEFDYRISSKQSYGITGCDFDVILHEHADHDHEHLHEHHHSHEHRHLNDIYAVIEQAQMTGRAKELAKKIFLIVAQAESKAHGCPVSEVHFHEVGAVDSIVDIISAAVLIDDLNITDCIVTGLTEGSGFVSCQHGDLPVPVPAVLNIAEQYGIPLRSSGVTGEMVTPTGIAIAAALRTRSSLPKQYKIVKTGTGLGKRDFGRANLLRAMIIEEDLNNDQIYIVECNIDDATGEELGFAMEKLTSAGARDVHFIPCFMKKNRPAYILRIITGEKELEEIEKTVFRYTSTIGLRKYPVDRTCMSRTMMTVSLPEADIAVKKCFLKDIVRYYPEYESVRAAAEKSGRPLRILYEQAALQAEKEDERR
ncbi:MAG: nickel pincer cofactor biosynthesis protein LarC [Alphaproteobacteria bacterium]|nr:nickel pincer cofactor biosynthesis protein LarC [Alphaproteobacteria bacterium]